MEGLFKTGKEELCFVTNLKLNRYLVGNILKTMILGIITRKLKKPQC